MVLNHIFKKELQEEIDRLGNEVLYHRLTNFENYLFEIIDSLRDGIIDLNTSLRIHDGYRIIIMEDGTILCSVDNSVKLMTLKCYNGEVFVSDVNNCPSFKDITKISGNRIADYRIGTTDVYYYRIPDTNNIQLSKYFVKLKKHKPEYKVYETKMMAGETDKNSRYIPECSINDILESYMELMSSLGF